MSDLPVGWTIQTLADVAEPAAPIIYGILQPGPNVPDGVLYVRPSEIQGGKILLPELRRTSPEIARRYERASLNAGDVILSIVGTIGKVAVVPNELSGGNITQSSCRIRGDSAIVSSEFLSAFLRAPVATDQYSNMSLGTAVPRLNLEDVRLVNIPLAPIAEQRRIVAKLDALTARTARARADLDRVAALDSRYRLALLRAAMRGQMTEDWRNRQPMVEPASDLVARTPAPAQGRGGRDATHEVIDGQAALSVNKPARSVPKGWSWTPLLRLARQETGHTPSRNVDAYWGGDVPWIGIRDAGANHGAIIHDTLQTITQTGLSNSSARLLPKGTVCLSRTASVGYVTMMGRPMATSQDFATWTCSDALEPKFLLYALMAEGDDIRSFGKGSTHTTIYFPEIRALHIALPPKAEQIEIVERLERALTEIDRLTAEAAAARRLLDRLDQAILAKAFQGELVPQDPADEPASVLLDRIRAERADAPKPRRGRRAAA